MPEIQLGVHTIRSHGARVARIHMHDWLILLLLVIIDGLLNIIEPFHRFVGEGMMVDLRYPLKDNTIPFWAVPIIAILLPLAVILVYYFLRKDVYDFHHAILGLLFAVLITSVITDAIKDGVGRPRPDFFWRCFPDGKEVFDPVTGDVRCTGDKSVTKEGYKSFPSGHTSWSFAGLVYLAWYLCGKIRVFDRRGHIAKLCLILLPVLMAALVAVSRVDDYWHHWQDVFAGSLIGTTVASVCYLQFFPPPYDIDVSVASTSGSIFAADTTDAFTTDRIFSTREEVEEWATSVGRSVGVVVIKIRSDKLGKRGTRDKIIFGCEKSGHFSNESRVFGSKKMIVHFD